MVNTPKLSVLELETNQDGTTTFNAAARVFEQGFAPIVILNRDLTSPPGSPAEGDAYIPAATATGAWVGLEDDVVYLENGAWTAKTPFDGLIVWIDDEGVYARWDAAGSAWVTWAPLGTVAAGITASTTQTQGQQPLTADLNVVTVVANANDVVTMPAAAAGRIVRVANDDAADTLQIFPASGDSFDGGTVNASTTLAAGGRATFVAQDATDWLTFG